MATRIHNFSYSGSTSLLTFVPCIDNERACKVYLKSLQASVSLTDGAIAIVDIRMIKRAADGVEALPVANFYFHGQLTNNYTGKFNFAGGCNSITLPNENDLRFFLRSQKMLLSGTGVGQLENGYASYHMPEYFYLKPNDTLSLQGYTGTFHIELMAISET